MVTDKDGPEIQERQRRRDQETRERRLLRSMRDARWFYFLDLPPGEFPTVWKASKMVAAVAVLGGCLLYGILGFLSLRVQLAGLAALALYFAVLGWEVLRGMLVVLQEKVGILQDTLDAAKEDSRTRFQELRNDFENMRSELKSLREEAEAIHASINDLSDSIEAVRSEIEGARAGDFPVYWSAAPELECGQQLNEKLCEKSLVGYRLKIVASISDLQIPMGRTAAVPWRITGDKAELEVILLDSVGSQLRDGEREYEAVTVAEDEDGGAWTPWFAKVTQIRAWDCVKVFMVGSAVDFSGFGLSQASEPRSTVIFVIGRLASTQLRFWLRELEEFEPAKYHCFRKAERRRRANLLGLIELLQKRLGDADGKRSEQQIMRIKRELYGEWADYDLDRAMINLNARSAMLRRDLKHLADSLASSRDWVQRFAEDQTGEFARLVGFTFEVKPRTFSMIETLDRVIEEGTVTVEVSLDDPKEPTRVFLSLQYYNGDMVVDNAMVCESETVHARSYEMGKYPEFEMVIRESLR